ncbi:MAG: BBE domain-containing protein [Mycobacterium sp.]
MLVVSADPQGYRPIEYSPPEFENLVAVNAQFDPEKVFLQHHGIPKVSIVHGKSSPRTAPLASPPIVVLYHST